MSPTPALNNAGDCASFYAVALSLALLGRATVTSLYYGDDLFGGQATITDALASDANTFPPHVPVIVRASLWQEMIRPYASSIIPVRAIVANAYSRWWQFSVMNKPGGDVGSYQFAITTVYHAISCLRCPSNPEPAGIRFLHLRPEPVFKGYREPDGKRGVLNEQFRHNQVRFGCVAPPAVARRWHLRFKKTKRKARNLWRTRYHR